MSIQEIALSNNQKKKILRAFNDENIAFKDDNGDVVVNVETYAEFKIEKNLSPIEDIINAEVLNFKNQYFLFS